MLGSEVELFARRARVLHDFDRELVERLQENYRQTGIALRLEHDVTALERAGAGRVRIAGVAEAFDAVLFATGRHPHTGDLGLHTAGVVTDARAHVCVNARQDTSADGVHTISHVTDRLPLAPGTIVICREQVRTPVHNATLSETTMHEKEIA